MGNCEGLSKKLLTFSESSYIQHELGINSPRRQKLILQRICTLHARGFMLASAAAYTLRQTLGGLITASRTDPKVRRWCLNTTALIGTAEESLDAVTYALDHYGSDPEILSSAVSALVRLDRNAFLGIANSANFSREAILLSGLRTVGPSMVDVRDLRLNIDVAEPEILKIALLAVGLDRAPSYMFDPSHENSAIVRALGAHDHPIVSQYSVWAISENNKLGLNDLGIPLSDIEALKPNVRGWVLRLFAERGGIHADRHDRIFQGSIDPEAEVRLSVAAGLRDTHYDGIEEIVPNWFADESDPEVKGFLMDHLVRQTAKAESYKGIVTSAYEFADQNNRTRMEAAAAGTPMFGEFQRLTDTAKQPLFNFMELTMGDKRNTSFGTVNAGAVSIEGDANNYGNVQNNLNSDKRKIAVDTLSEILDYLPNLPVTDGRKEQLKELANTAKSNPNKALIEKVTSALKSTEEALGSVAGAGGHITTLAGYAALLMALF